MKDVRFKAGNLYRVPLRDGTAAFAQLLPADLKLGSLVQVFRKITVEDPHIDLLLASGELFPQVLVDLQGGVRFGNWTYFGFSPIQNFEFPTFRNCVFGLPGGTENWWLWDGKTRRRIGILPEECRKLEMEIVWSYSDLEDRIYTGKNVYQDIH